VKEGYWRRGAAGVMMRFGSSGHKWTLRRGLLREPKSRCLLGRLFFDPELMCQLIKSGVAEEIKAD
jgi:hypothetical protein